jgi:hypothetical protein
VFVDGRCGDTANSAAQLCLKKKKSRAAAHGSNRRGKPFTQGTKVAVVKDHDPRGGRKVALW